MSRVYGISFSLAVALGLACVSSADGALFYNFDTPGTETQNNGHGDGAQAQGWTDTLGASEASFTVGGGRTSVVPGNQDSQNVTMVFSSPQFVLVPVGASAIVSVDLAGGLGNGGSAVASTDLPKNLSDLGPNGTLSGQNPTNVLVLGLRKVSDNSYVSFLQRTATADAWSTYTWDLSAFADGNTAYQIDQIDSRYGSWGHIEMDNVSIPGTLTPEPGSLALLGLGSLGLLRRRRGV